MPLTARSVVVSWVTLTFLVSINSIQQANAFSYDVPALVKSIVEMRQKLRQDSGSVRFPSWSAETPLSSSCRNRSMALPVTRFRSVPRLRGARKLLFGALSCASRDLSLTQGPVSSRSGIPTFSVQIVNLCGTCAMADIHVACGNWASATPVDPFVFTRLRYNDCLVNNGRPLTSQGSVSFQYSNSAMYSMTIASATNEWRVGPNWSFSRAVIFPTC